MVDYAEFCYYNVLQKRTFSCRPSFINFYGLCELVKNEWLVEDQDRNVILPCCTIVLFVLNCMDHSPSLYTGVQVSQIEGTGHCSDVRRNYICQAVGSREKEQGIDDAGSTEVPVGILQGNLMGELTIPCITPSVDSNTCACWNENNEFLRSVFPQKLTPSGSNVKLFMKKDGDEFEF